ncbi:MAG TPA: TetR family transcriptional regulator [Candidatus Acidoferrales bacterium]|nr:TetR family transcriptional regulator [Candidatus Acidoferrales bacterium]
MGRWLPNAQGRLIQAAMHLYSERGYEQTTVAEIAKQAGLTERTFFRYFKDKREVLFFGSEMLERNLVEALERAPADLAPIDALGATLESAGSFFEPERLAHSRRRQAVIDANPELQERERKKLASIAVTLAAALQRRGVKGSTATLLAEMGIAVFKLAFEAWLSDPRERAYTYHLRASLNELKALSAGSLS